MMSHCSSGTSQNFLPMFEMIVFTPVYALFTWIKINLVLVLVIKTFAFSNDNKLVLQIYTIDQFSITSSTEEHKITPDKFVRKY